MNLDVSGVPGWQIDLPTQSEQVEAPPSERVRTRGWTICTVTVSAGGLYAGSLRNITAVDRPTATASCSRGGDGLVVPCAQPHSAEYLAWTWREVPDPERSAAPLGADGFYDLEAALRWPADLDVKFQKECADVAATILGTADPTRGGLLRAVFLPSIFSASTDDSAVAVAVGQCVIEPAVDGRQLVGSLIGLGDATPTFG